MKVILVLAIVAFVAIAAESQEKKHSHEKKHHHKKHHHHHKQAHHLAPTACPKRTFRYIQRHIRPLLKGIRSDKSNDTSKYAAGLATLTKIHEEAMKKEKACHIVKDAFNN